MEYELCCGDDHVACVGGLFQSDRTRRYLHMTRRADLPFMTDAESTTLWTIVRFTHESRGVVAATFPECVRSWTLDADGFLQRPSASTPLVLFGHRELPVLVYVNTWPELKMYMNKIGRVQSFYSTRVDASFGGPAELREIVCEYVLK
jgi:hypothetical protein